MLTDKEWQKKLTPLQYKVLRQKGTEPPFSGELLTNNNTGEYKCAGCDTVLFKSSSRYESDIPGLAGWPSFSEAAKSDTVEFIDDKSHGMQRVEVVCKKCGGHLGHIFEDESSTTGKHYCINSVSLNFEAKDK